MGRMRMTLSAQRLVEQLLHLVEKSFRHGIDILTTDGGKVFEQLFLLTGQMCRCFYRDAHMLVALLKSLHVFDASALHAKEFAGLCAG